MCHHLLTTLHLLKPGLHSTALSCCTLLITAATALDTCPLAWRPLPDQDEDDDHLPNDSSCDRLHASTWCRPSPNAMTGSAFQAGPPSICMPCGRWGCEAGGAARGPAGHTQQRWLCGRGQSEGHASHHQHRCPWLLCSRWGVHALHKHESPLRFQQKLCPEAMNGVFRTIAHAA